MRAWHGPIHTQACQRADDHRRSWMRSDGTVMCEDCARVKAGWKPCRVPVGSCPNLVAPKPPTVDGISPPSTPWVPLCEIHEPLYEVIGHRECDATGEYECTDMDCHGRYCDDGMVECDGCVDGLIWVESDRRVNA